MNDILIRIINCNTRDIVCGLFFCGRLRWIFLFAGVGVPFKVQLCIYTFDRWAVTNIYHKPRYSSLRNEWEFKGNLRQF